MTTSDKIELTEILEEVLGKRLDLIAEILEDLLLLRMSEKPANQHQEVRDRIMKRRYNQ